MSDETLWHAFGECPVSITVWRLLDIDWITTGQHTNCFGWLTRVFERCSELKNACFVATYGLSGWIEIGTLVGEEEKWKALEGSLIKINCDAFFDRHGHKAALGVVIRNGRGDILVSTTRLNTEVGSTFDAEALACLDGVLIGVSLGLTEVIVEGDSRSIISKCKSGFLRDRKSVV